MLGNCNMQLLRLNKLVTVAVKAMCVLVRAQSSGRHLLGGNGDPFATGQVATDNGLRRLLGSGGAPTATGEVAVDNGRRLLGSGGAPTATGEVAVDNGRRLLGSGGAPTATGEVAVDNGRRLLDAATSGDSADSSPTVRHEAVRRVVRCSNGGTLVDWCVGSCQLPVRQRVCC